MTIEATNINRSYAAKAQSLAADFESAVIDFKDMPMAAIHCKWTGAAGASLDGTFKIYASNFPELDSFDPEGTLIDGADFPVHNANGGRIWIRERLAFRYALVRYTKGSMTAGTVDIVAIGKKT